jgi:hypothetical protein
VLVVDRLGAGLEADERTQGLDSSVKISVLQPKSA